MGSAVVLAVYTAGYMRTRAAAERFADRSNERRPVPAIVVPAAEPAPPLVASSPAASVPPRADARPQSSPRPAGLPASVQHAASTAVAAPRATSPAAAPVVAVPAAPATPASAAPASAPSITESTPAASAPVPAQPIAPASSEVAATAVAAPAPAAPKYKDGTYFGWGTSRHGDIQAQVVIANGRISAATISQCLTRYSCSRIAALLPQVAQRQSAEVDFVSGATESTNAFYYAVIEALAKAR